MRLFLAIDLPQSIGAALEALVAQQIEQLPPARWVRRQNLHLTLDFLGDQDADTARRLLGVIEPVTNRQPPLRLVMAGPGTFPAGRPARVAWIGLAECAGLGALCLELRLVLDEALGRAPDGRPFHLHLTMARCNPTWPLRAVERWCAARCACAGQEFQVTYIDLMQSRLTPSGPTYKRLRSFPLEG